MPTYYRVATNLDVSEGLYCTPRTASDSANVYNRVSPIDELIE
jgi:hypothetical protein